MYFFMYIFFCFAETADISDLWSLNEKHIYCNEIEHNKRQLNCLGLKWVFLARTICQKYF